MEGAEGGVLALRREGGVECRRGRMSLRKGRGMGADGGVIGSGREGGRRRVRQRAIEEGGGRVQKGGLVGEGI